MIRLSDQVNLTVRKRPSEEFTFSLQNMIRNVQSLLLHKKF